MMTQDERWMIRFEEVKRFIEDNHRNPSKYVGEERMMLHFLKRGRKLMNAGKNNPKRLWPLASYSLRLRITSM